MHRPSCIYVLSWWLFGGSDRAESTSQVPGLNVVPGHVHACAYDVVLSGGKFGFFSSCLFCLCACRRSSVVPRRLAFWCSRLHAFVPLCLCAFVVPSRCPAFVSVAALAISLRWSSFVVRPPCFFRRALTSRRAFARQALLEGVS